MSERLTRRNEKDELLFNGIQVIAGEHWQAYLELEDAEGRIEQLEAKLSKWLRLGAAIIEGQGQILIHGDNKERGE